MIELADVFTKEKRSQIMAQIKGSNTSIEMKVRSYLHKSGFRFRVNDKRYIGKPDIVLPKYNTIIFINGCFWHGHGCKYSVIPKSNVDYWEKKIFDTITRDKMVTEKLIAEGWNVVVIWECEIKESFANVMTNLIQILNLKEKYSDEN